jgi:glycine cleavage system H protein
MNIQGYIIPEDLYYDEYHFWVRPEGSSLTMGMTDFAQSLAGDIVFVQLPFDGKKLERGKKFAKVESGKWVGKVFAPVKGVLAGSNKALEKNPGLVNKDCYGEGWMYKIKPDDMAELDRLIHGTAAIEKWMLAEIEKHKG